MHRFDMLDELIKLFYLKYINVKIAGKESEIEKVKTFFYSYHDDFRTIKKCSEITGINPKLCKIIKDYLQSNNEIGCFFYGENPQIEMHKYIVKKFSQISNDSNILEIGPGGNPIFDPRNYKNWWALDKYLEKDTIEYGQFQWDAKKYPQNRIIKEKWEDLSNFLNKYNFIGTFDIIVASHVFEHTTEPIKCLIECRNALKNGGVIVLFVPDGFAVDSGKDPGHTLYLVKSMILEFFKYTGGFMGIAIDSFRPDCDLVITAIKNNG